VVKCDVLDSQTSVRMPTLEAVPAISLHHAKVKYDGYRLRLEREGGRVRLITRGGYNWATRYPWIAEAALKNRQKRFVIEVSNPSVGKHPHGGSTVAASAGLATNRPSAAFESITFIVGPP
jgi:hypothetical protein